MAIVSGVNIPDNKRVEISLRSVYGIGPSQARQVVRRPASAAIPR
jgi:small subunit ribosomal protein S13